jgi:Spy/CpxP family protein refolding chaperone
MRRLSKTVLAVLATVVPSAVAVAQNPPTTPPRQPQSRAGQPARVRPDSGARRPTPAQFGVRRGGPATNLLRLREQLELTDDQVKRLEALQAVAPPEPKVSERMRAEADLIDATKGDVNLEKARAAFERMSRLRVDEQLAELKVRQDARNVLTAAQKSKFDAFSANMRDGQRSMERTMRMRGQPDMRGMRGMQENVRQMQREFNRGQIQFRGGRGGPGMPPGMMAPQGRGGARGMMGPPMGPQGQGVPPEAFVTRRRMPPPGPLPPDTAAPPADQK